MQLHSLLAGPQKPPRVSKGVNCLKIAKVRGHKPAHVTEALGKVPAACATCILGSLLATGVVLATEADVQTIPTSFVTQMQAVQAPQQASRVAQQLSPSPSSFDLVLLSIIHATDNLSAAADSLLDLTAAATHPAAPNTALDPCTTTTSRRSSSSGSSLTMPGGLQLTPVLHPAPAPSTATSQPDYHALHKASTLQETPSTAHMLSQQEHNGTIPDPLQQVSTLSSQPDPILLPEAPSTAALLSRQALTVAAQALELATLLEGQGTEGADPDDVELLQQIGASARQVSVLAADIVQEPQAPVGLDFTELPADTSSSSSSSSEVSPAAAAEAAVPSSSSGTGSGTDSGTGSGTSDSPRVQGFLGLPVLGLQGSTEACVAHEAAAADVLQHCLQL